MVPDRFPTRMARRTRPAAQPLDAWQPDPLVTAPVLQRVEDELAALLGSAHGDAAPRPDVTPRPYALQPDPTPSAAPETAPPHTPRAARHRQVPGRRRLLTAAMAIVLITVAVVAVLFERRAAVQAPAAAALAPSRPDVLVLALARSRQLTGLSLLVSGVGAPQHVLVPSRLVLDVPGAGRVPLSQALGPGDDAVGAAIADALDIRVDATWVLDTAALAMLVDRLGGVIVDVDVDVESPVAAGSDAGGQVIVAAGPDQRLAGRQAAAYAQLAVGSEPEAARLARQEQVVEAVLGRLPADVRARRAVLDAVAGKAVGGWVAAAEVVVRATGGLREPAAAARLASILMPVDDIDAGGDTESYGLDEAAAAALVSTRLPGAARPVPAGGRIRVLVQNGVGAPGLGDAARSRLVAAGLRYVGGGNIDGFGVTSSLVLLPDGSALSRARGATVVRALGLTNEALRITDTPPTIADLVVVLGKDFE